MKRLSRWTSNRYVTYAIHVLFWLLLIFPFLGGPSHPVYFERVMYRIIFNNSFLIVLFYFNGYYLFPKIYQKMGWVTYIISALATVGILMYISFYLQGLLMPINEYSHLNTHQLPGRPEGGFPPEGFPHPPGGHRGFFPFPMYLFIIAISFSYRLMMDQNIQEKKRKEQETETLKTELNFLRSQISPHFMFNVLNTLVAMARKKSDLMEPSLIQLSTLMRYVLHDSNNSRISLSKEVEYLKNYIELQSLRFGDDLNLVLDIVPHTEDYEIEPMLLIPFVENAFKHGLGTGDSGRLYVHLKVEPILSQLQFRVENQIAPVSDSKDECSGIGLKNVTRRLELLYYNKYTLQTMIKDNIFIAELKIQLQ